LLLSVGFGLDFTTALTCDFFTKCFLNTKRTIPTVSKTVKMVDTVIAATCPACKPFGDSSSAGGSVDESRAIVIAKSTTMPPPLDVWPVVARSRRLLDLAKTFRINTCSFIAPLPAAMADLKASRCASWKSDRRRPLSWHVPRSCVGVSVFASAF